MSSSSIYCTYLTTYSGNKLPPFYIGSTSLAKIAKGYCGSISSKKWKAIYKEELKNFPEKFKVEILNTFDTRCEALEAELELQKANDVVRSKWFFNEALATVNGFFGPGQLGMKKSELTKSRMRGNKNAASNKNKPKTMKHRQAMSLAAKNRILDKSFGEAVSAAKLALKVTFMNNGIKTAAIPLDLLNEAYAQGWVKGKMKKRT